MGFFFEFQGRPFRPVNKSAPLFCMAGPCALESRAHALEVSAALKEIFTAAGRSFLSRSSFDKTNRSSGSSFRGVDRAKGCLFWPRCGNAGAFRGRSESWWMKFWRRKQLPVRYQKRRASMTSFPTWTNLAAFVPRFVHGSADVFSPQAKLAFLRRKLRSRWRKGQENIVYRLAVALLAQDRLVLLSSSLDDKFSNITALSEKLCERAMPFIRLTQEQLQAHPLRSLVSLARARVLVIDAASPASRIKLHRNTCLIHCWHAGGAYKKVAFDAKRKNYDDASEEKRIKRIHRGISWFVWYFRGNRQHIRQSLSHASGTDAGFRQPAP